MVAYKTAYLWLGKLFGDAIIQWGLNTATTTKEIKNFNITFPRTVRAMVGNYVDYSNSTELQFSIISFQFNNLSGYTDKYIVQSNFTNSNYFWIALG